MDEIFLNGVLFFLFYIIMKILRQKSFAHLVNLGNGRIANAVESSSPTVGDSAFYNLPENLSTREQIKLSKEAGKINNLGSIQPTRDLAGNEVYRKGVKASDAYKAGYEKALKDRNKILKKGIKKGTLIALPAAAIAIGGKVVYDRKKNKIR